MKLYPEYKTKKLFSLRDLVAIATILAIILASFLLQSTKTDEEVMAYISYNNTLSEYSLSRDATITIDENLGIYAKIEAGKIALTENDCKNQICVKTGYISKPNEAIICAPHRLVIYISSNEKRLVTYA